MQIKTGTVRGAKRLAQLPDLSSAARLRLKWMDYYEGCGRNAALTCRHFGISRQTFYRWKRRYDPQRVATLEDRARRPRRTRQPTWSPQLAQAVLALREERPRWGKDKLAFLLREQGWRVSTSMVGRILRHLRQRGVLREPLPNALSVRKRLLARPYAVRKPKGYSPTSPAVWSSSTPWTCARCRGWC